MSAPRRADPPGSARLYGHSCLDAGNLFSTPANAALTLVGWPSGLGHSADPALGNF
jgi:hypothetical protein